jgi:hypothetical protein
MTYSKYLRFWLALMPLVTTSGIKISISKDSSQGIEGYIYRISGNHMPSPGVKPARPKGIKTTLYIYPVTNLNQVSRQGNSSFYMSIQTKLIRKVKSDTSGYFNVKLPTGEYSLFVKVDSLYYSNLFDGKNNIFPVNVLPNKMTRVEFKMDHDAVY